MVDKLKLTSVHYRTSYKVSWFKKDGEILVSQKYKIKFSIGRYEDEVYFIILHMDVCYLLLDRIWQFDQNTHYNKRKNTYSLIKVGIKFLL